MKNLCGSKMLLGIAIGTTFSLCMTIVVLREMTRCNYKCSCQKSSHKANSKYFDF